MMQAIHKTFEQSAGGKRTTILWTSDGEEVYRLNAKEQLEFFQALRPGMVVRVSAVNAMDVQLLTLADRGVTIRYAYFHDLGIPKGLEPDEFVFEFANAPEDVFKTFVPRPDLAELRRVLMTRNALLTTYGDGMRSLRQIGRNAGVVDDADFCAEYADAMESLDAIFGLSSFKGKNGSGRIVSWDTLLKDAASKVPECVVFNKVAGIKGSWVTAASIVAMSGGIERFPTVHHFWSYCGMGVVEGVAPKRRKGNPVRWNPAVRTALYNLGASLIKHRDNPWRDYYDQVKAHELEVHDQKHPDCSAKAGHCDARARRKMVKEILKRFFIAAKSQEFNENHATSTVIVKSQSWIGVA